MTALDPNENFSVLHDHDTCRLRTDRGEASFRPLDYVARMGVMTTMPIEGYGSAPF